MNKPFRTAARRLLGAVAVALMTTLIACSPGQITGDGENDDATGDAVTQGENVDTVFAVNVTPAVKGEINDYIEINGDVQTTASVDVFSDTNGEIVRLYTRVGQTVQAGATIAEVDPSRPGQNFSLSPVRSPITGTITRLPARVGAQVAPSAPVAQVSRTNDLEIVVNVAERFISKVSEGLPAVVSLDAFPERTFNATVTDLSPVVDPLTRTLEVTLRFDRLDPVIRAGMFAEVRIITEQKDNIVKVPSDVLIRRFGETFVYVVTDDDTVERRVVNPGIEIDNKLEITDGLAPNERVVYQGQNLLEDGSRVRVIDTVEPLTVEDTVR
ncbi:MAG: efflux RND transporter periplasmic adaptor subunit [Alkalispirochaeta sp.]